MSMCILSCHLRDCRADGLVARLQSCCAQPLGLVARADWVSRGCVGPCRLGDDRVW